uniref:Uncharacterized protein n=1 Tax=Cacopsylla melanoneura TaxID=428564 RepID=A0A8D8LAC9_9HEMI
MGGNCPYNNNFGGTCLERKYSKPRVLFFFLCSRKLLEFHSYPAFPYIGGKQGKESGRCGFGFQQFSLILIDLNISVSTNENGAALDRKRRCVLHDGRTLL